MKIISWALMLIGAVCLVVAFYYHSAPLGWIGGPLFIIGEGLPRNPSPALPPVISASRPVARQTVKREEKSA